MASHPHKTIIYPYNSYYGSNIIRLTWSGNKVEGCTTQNFLEYHQDAGDSIIINRRRSFSGLIHTLLGVAVLCKVHIQPSVASVFTYRQIRYM